MEIVLTLILAFIVPALVEIAMKRGHFRWLESWFREAWAVLICFLTIYILWQSKSQEYAMSLHGYFKNHVIAGYVFAALVGAIIFSGYWRFTERFADSDTKTKSEPGLAPIPERPRETQPNIPAVKPIPEAKPPDDTKVVRSGPPDSIPQRPNETAKEQPRLESQPTSNQATPNSSREFKPKIGDPLDKEESPFAVSVEWAMFSIGGKGHGTSFWAYYPSQDGCSISPIQAVFFIRVKNLRSMPATVIGYSLDVLGAPLRRTNMGSIVYVPQKGSIAGPKRPTGYPIEKGLNFGQGPGFSMVQFALNESDFTQGALLQMDLIENLLKTPLQPNMPIRGWAFYESPNENAFTVAGPGHITLETDDSRTFSHDFDLRNPHPELDILDRVIMMKSFIDLSGCRRP
jgi:hypothetical protein